MVNSLRNLSQLLMNNCDTDNDSLIAVDLPNPPTPSSRWVDSIGHSLFKSVTISFGGDREPVWYCRKCRCFKSEREPEPGTVCGSKEEDFSYDLFRKYWQEERGTVLSDEEIDDLDPEWEDWLAEEYDVYTRHYCDGDEYYLHKSEGVKVDEWSTDFLDLWDQFAKASPNTPDPQDADFDELKGS